MKRVLTIVAAFLMVATVAAPASAAPGKKAADLPAPAQQSMNADMNGNNLFDNLEEKLAAARSNEGIDVIVQLQDGIEDQALTVLESFNGFSHKVRWNAAINGFAATLNPGQIRAISHSPIVKTVELDLPVQAYMGTATQWTGVNQARTDYGVDGDRDGVKTTYSTTDIVVAIIDTGIDAAHVDLDGGKVIAFRDEVNGRTTAYDDHGHGSHVASIVAGTGEANSAYKGVAPGTALVGVKVLNSAGSGTTTQIVNGVNWVINNKATYNIRIANMSLGASGCSSGTDSISTAVNNANNAGIAMFVAAGNDGPGTCTVGAPGAATGAITVGAGIDPGEKGWGLAYFSSRGLTADGRLKPDIVTPGYNITAAKANSTNQYVAMSGTSMATPFAAGIGALILDANPSYTVTSLKNNLYANVQDWGPAGHDKDYGRGIVLAYNAVKQAAGGTGSWSSGLAHSYTSGSLTATGQSAYYSFTVTDATKPIAVTLINGGSQDFDLYLLNPSGTQVGASEGTTRQEQVLFQPTVTGTYKARIYSYSGTGTYFADISFK